MFARIYRGLDRLELHGGPARDAARMGFLEWVFALEPDVCAARVARTELARLPDANAPSPAAAAFLGFVAEAARADRIAPRRKGGRRRVLH